MSNGDDDETTVDSLTERVAAAADALEAAETEADLDDIEADLDEIADSHIAAAAACCRVVIE